MLLLWFVVLVVALCCCYCRGCCCYCCGCCCYCCCWCCGGDRDRGCLLVLLMVLLWDAPFFLHGGSRFTVTRCDRCRWKAWTRQLRLDSTVTPSKTMPTGATVSSRCVGHCLFIGLPSRVPCNECVRAWATQLCTTHPHMFSVAATRPNYDDRPVVDLIDDDDDDIVVL